MIDPEASGGEDRSILYFQQGVPEAFKVFFFEYYPELFSFATMLVQDRDVAQQVAMDGFFLLWERRADFDSDKKIKAFLYVAIRNNCLKYLREMAAYAAGQTAGTHAPAQDLPDDILQDIYDFADAAPY